MKIITPKLEIYQLEKGIILIRPLYEDDELDVKDGHDLAHAFDALAGGQPFGSLLDVYESNATLTSELRKFGAGKHYRSPQVGRAVVLQSLMHRLLTNHFINTFHPSVETKFFGEKEEAVSWLRGKLAAYRPGK